MFAKLKYFAVALAGIFMGGCFNTSVISAVKRHCFSRQSISLDEIVPDCTASIQCQLRVFGPDVAPLESSLDINSSVSARVFHFNSSDAIENEKISDPIDGESDYFRAEAICATSKTTIERVGKTIDARALLEAVHDSAMESCAGKAGP